MSAIWSLLPLIARSGAKEQDHTAPLKAEFANLQREMDRFLDSIPGASSFYKKMNLVNPQLWQLENKVRAMIRAGDAGNAYIKTALSITLTNEKRSALKVAINKVATTGIEPSRSAEGSCVYHAHARA